MKQKYEYNIDKIKSLKNQVDTKTGNYKSFNAVYRELGYPLGTAHQWIHRNYIVTKDKGVSGFEVKLKGGI